MDEIDEKRIQKLEDDLSYYKNEVMALQDRVWNLAKQLAEHKESDHGN